MRERCRRGRRKFGNRRAVKEEQIQKFPALLRRVPNRCVFLAVTHRNTRSRLQHHIPALLLLHNINNNNNNRERIKVRKHASYLSNGIVDNRVE